MAQDPLGDAAQQPWYPQQAQPDWPAGYPDQQQWQGSHGYDGGAGYAEAGRPDHGHPDHGQAQHGYAQHGYGQSAYPQAGYGQGGYPQAGYAEPGYPETGYAETGYGQGGQPGGQHQPYYQYDDYGQQQYAPYAVPQQPAGEELYAPAGAEYSTDGYVHIEPEPVAEPEPHPPAAVAAPEPAAPGPRSAGRRGGGRQDPGGQQELVAGGDRAERVGRREHGERG
ncbi:hypothetical protein ACWDRR_41450, partial [Kitasatospora sp. NPDC003701]